jgi:hypothetical protein
VGLAYLLLLGVSRGKSGESVREVTMRRVRLQRIVQDGTKEFVTLGSVFEGLEPLKPRAGQEYLMFDDSGKVVRTSPVVRVHDGFFETQNSFYKLTVLEEEPFDLGGEETPGKTQEINLAKLANTSR